MIVGGYVTGEMGMRLLTISLILACSACSKSTGSPVPMTRQQVFALWDTSKDGQISHEEWMAQVSRAAAMAPEANRQSVIEQSEEHFRELDTNGDGKLSFEEYFAPPPPTPSNWIKLKPIRVAH
jgi:hypothetical protein